MKKAEKTLSKEKSDIDSIRDNHYQNYQSDLLQIKINLKGNKIIWEQRNEYLKSKVKDSQKDLHIFEKKWHQYFSSF